MSGTNKVLQIFFFTLLIIIIAEVAYFFFYQPGIQTKKPYLSPSISNNQNASDDNMVINKSQIEYLSSLKKISVDNLKVFYSMGGIGIVSNVKKITDKQISFDLTDENGKKSTGIKFPVVENIPFHIYISNNGSLISARMEDLSSGDKIKFLWTYDLEKQPGKEDLYDNELVIYKNPNEKIY